MKKTYIVIFITLIIIGFYKFGYHLLKGISNIQTSNTNRIVNRSNKEIKINDFSINSIIIGQPITKKIEEIFGMPIKIEVNPIIGKHYYYKDILINTCFKEGKEIFNGFTINSENTGIDSGIRIGDTVEKVLNKYGEGYKSEELSLYEYSLSIKGNRFFSDGDYILLVDFFYENSKISKIDARIVDDSGY